MKALEYIKGRCGERSTWMAVGAGITSAAALAMPWAGLFLLVAVIAALIPDGPVKKP